MTMRKTHIYIIGIVLLGFTYEYVKRAMPHGALFLLACVVYLVLLRLLAERFGKP
jgi:hypothetical protein